MSSSDQEDSSSIPLPPRPQILYLAIFSWMTLSGGRFLAPFLEHEAHMTDPTNIGFTLALQYAIMSVTSPLFGILADRTEQRYPQYGRAYWLMGGVMVGCAVFCLHGLSSVLDMTIGMSSSCSFTDSFGFHLMIQSLYALCLSLEFPVIDGMTLSYLQMTGGNTNEYGLERLFGAVSWGLTSLVFGMLLDVSGFGWKVTYLLIFISTILCVMTALYYAKGQDTYVKRVSQSKSPVQDPLSREVPPATNSSPASEVTPLVPSPMPSPKSSPYRNNQHTSHPQQQQQQQYSQWNLIYLVIGSAYGLAFAITYFTLASGLSVVENMVFLFFEMLGGSNTICGITVLLTVLLELPMFHFAPQLLERYGPGSLLLAAGGSFIIRIMGYTFIPEGQLWMVLLLEPLHGITYAGSQTAAVEFIGSQMPAGYESSGQGIVNLIRGSGSVLGLWLAGNIQATLGPRIMYRGFAIVISTAMLCFGYINSRTVVRRR
jgi:hypothetical protein